MTTSIPELPDRLLRNGRPIDNDFDPDEPLYLRFQGDDVRLDEDGNQILNEGCIKYPAFSVNRGKFSEPDDVLFRTCVREMAIARGQDPSKLDISKPTRFEGWGVARFQVRDIPPPDESAPNTFEYCVAHDPCEDNYSHSEVRTLKNARFDPKVSLPTQVKKRYRFFLSKRLSVVIPAGE